MITPDDPLYVPTMRQLMRSLAECPGWNLLVLPMLRASFTDLQEQILTGDYVTERALFCDRARFMELHELEQSLQKTARSVFSASTGTLTTSADDQLFPTPSEVTGIMRALSFQPELVPSFQALVSESTNEQPDDFQLFQGIPQPIKRP
jgi:hypothetical protein